jgi:integrase/recombinase XerD
VPRKGDRRRPRLATADPRGLGALVGVYLEYREVRSATPKALKTLEQALAGFVLFCAERSLTKAEEVTKPVIDRYQRHLFFYRKKDGQPLSIGFQHTRLSMLRSFFRWLTRQGYIPGNPASEIELPRLPERLPPNVLSVSEVEEILSCCDVTTTLGRRDRAMLELFYGTGIRRKELRNLKVFDLDFSRGVLYVRLGKGGKDRVVPMGERAAAWVEKYLSDGRGELVVEPDEGWLFLNHRGQPFELENLSTLVRRLILKSGVRDVGACHLFRHTMATLMLEGGADIRFVQEMLGHRKLETTQVYTHVAIKKLKEIHAATHPGARLKPPENGHHDDERR